MQTNQQLVRRERDSDKSAVDSPRWLDTPYVDSNAPGSSGDSLRISALLRRYRGPVLIIFAVFLLTGLIWTKLTPVTYQAKILLEVMAQNQDYLNTKALDPNSTMASPDTYLETQTKLLTTDAVVDRTAKVLGPAVPAYLLERKGLVTKLRGLLGQRTAPPTGEDIVRNMISTAKVKPEGQASLISVTMEGPDPKLTADAANTLAEEYIQHVQESRWNAAARTGQFLSVQLEGMRKKLQTSEDALQTYARNVGLIYTDASHESVAAERLREIQVDLARAEADLDDKQSQLELVKASPADSLPKVSDDGSIRDYKSRLADLRRQEADLEASYTPEHYRVKHVKSQIADLEATMEKERGTIVSRIQNDFQASKRREQLLADTYRRQLATVSDQSLAQVRYNMLQREVEASRDVYQAMLQRVKEAGVMSALRASNIGVANPARVPTAPYAPSLPKAMGVALLGAIMTSVLFVLVRERSNRSIRNPGESIKLIAVPELGVIPSTRIASRTSPMFARRKVLAIAGEGERPLPAAITSWNTNQSIVKESIRSLVTSLVMYGESFYRNRIILMTSPHPQAGKTTAVSNLGLALAESGRKVLVIDGDLRRPRLSETFGVQQDKGLAELLTTSREKVSLESTIQQTPYPNLFILPSGDAATELPRLLHSPRLEEILATVRNQYDFILLDSPPMLALTDARLLSRNTDGVILVCRAGKTTGEQLAFSYRRLAEDGIEVIGTILNDWDPRSEDPTYFNSYSDYVRSARV
jgi:capsular exopolysaccharide synthesis family protein